MFNGLEPHLQHEAHLPLGALGELLPIEAGPSLHGQGAACAQHTLSIWQDTTLHASGNSHVHPKALLRRSLQATMLTITSSHNVEDSDEDREMDKEGRRAASHGQHSA